MKKNLVKKAAVALSMTAIISSQTLSVCAAPVNDFSAVGKDNLLRYYEENFDVAKFPFFDVQKYKSEYPDLQTVFGDDLSLYLNHYLNHGIFENRKSGGEIDIISVAKKYPDIKITTNMDLTSTDVLVQVEKQVKVEEQKAADAVEAAKVAAQPTASTSSGSTTTADSGNNSSSNSGNNGSSDSGNSGSGGSNEEDKVTYDEEAYNGAVAEWQEEEPVKEDYLSDAGYYAEYSDWLDAEPDKNDYLSTDGQATYQAWQAQEPDIDEYLDNSDYDENYAEWQGEEPDPAEYTVGYPSEDAAQEACDADHAEWYAGKPVAETEDEYNARVEAWEAENPAPELDDYLEKVNDYASEEEARAAYEEDLGIWADDEPVKSDYYDVDAFNVAHTEWTASEPTIGNGDYELVH